MKTTIPLVQTYFGYTPRFFRLIVFFSKIKVFQVKKIHLNNFSVKTNEELVIRRYKLVAMTINGMRGSRILFRGRGSE